MIDSLKETIGNAYDFSESKLNQPYDGVMGKLPKEWPVNFHSDFELARDGLFRKGYSCEELLRYKDEMINIFECLIKTEASETVFAPSIPFQIWDEIETLTRFFIANSLGIDSGLEYLTDAAHAKTFHHGKSYIKAQSLKAKQPRSKIDHLINSLVKNYPEESAKELWPRLFGELDAAGFSPEEINNDGYNYESDSGMRFIKISTFNNKVSKFRTIIHDSRAINIM